MVAIGTDLAYGAVTKTVGGWRHFRQGTVDVPLALWMGVGSVPGALGGVLRARPPRSAAYGDSIDDGVMIAVAAALLFTGVAVLARALFMPKLVERERDDIVLIARATRSRAVALGVTSGFVLGATSAGSGALIAVGLILIFRPGPHARGGHRRVPRRRSLLWAAAIAHVVAGNVDFALVGNDPDRLGARACGSAATCRCSCRWPTLRLALAVVLIGAALGLLSKAGAGIPTPALAAAPVLLALLVSARYFSWRPRLPRRTPAPVLLPAPPADE